jgi:hypothetical protein
MTRELAAHHDPVVLAAPHVGAAHPGPVRRALKPSPARTRGWLALRAADVAAARARKQREGAA